MKLSLPSLAVGAALAALCAPARAADFAGLWGAGFDGGWGGRLGSENTREFGGNGLALGGSLLYGISPSRRAALNYEHVDLGDRHLTAVTASESYDFLPGARWNPFVELGAGAARATNVPDSSGSEPSLVWKVSTGLEYVLTPGVTASARAAFYNAGRTSSVMGHEVDAAVLGVGLAYWFGARPSAPPAPPEPPPAPPPPPAPAPVPPPPAPIAPPPAPEPPAPKRVSISLEVQFEVRLAVVRPEYEGRIAEVAAFLQKHPAATAEIEGHTDTLGDPAFNLALSQRRADAVRAYMISKYGIAPARLTAKGYGSSRPIGDNATRAGRAKNRRVVSTIDAQE